jgi:RNA polymerase sigma factor (sigma-70 family)
MNEHDGLAEEFETQRGHLRAVAYRMLGSLSDADDAVQEAWLRLSRADVSEVDNLSGWLRTVVSRVCLDILRTRESRREEPAGQELPDLSWAAGEGGDPEHEALLADSVGRALLVVLDTLAPAERIAFVLHDLFSVPFEQIAPIVGRSAVTTKKLASRARQRMRGTPALPRAELVRQRHVVDAFLTASRTGDMAALLAVLAPDVIRRADPLALPPGAATVVRGAQAVAEETVGFGRRSRYAVPALLNGSVGVVFAPYGRMELAISVDVRDEVITGYEVIAEPWRLTRLELGLLELLLD